MVAEHGLSIGRVTRAVSLSRAAYYQQNVEPQACASFCLLPAELFAIAPNISSIMIVEPLNIILFNIFSNLHFNNMQRNYATIFQTMFGTYRNISAFIFCNCETFFAACNSRRTGHHDPMLGAVLMTLQTQLAARNHCDTLNFAAAVFIFQQRVTAPWTLHGDMCHLLFGTTFFSASTTSRTR